MWPLRSEEVLEASNWEKKEMSRDFLAPESPEALAAIQFTEIRWPHSLTEIQILVPREPDQGQPGLQAAWPALPDSDTEPTLAPPATRPAQGDLGLDGLVEGCLSQRRPSSQGCSENPQAPGWALMCLLAPHVTLPAFQSDPPAVSPSTITLPPKPDLGIRF